MEEYKYIYQSNEEKEAAKTEKPSFKLSFDYIKEKIFSSAINKAILIGFAVLSTIGITVYEWYTNPPRTFTIEGYVYTVNKSGKYIPLNEAVITIENHSARTKTNKSGKFSIQVIIYKDDKSVQLICSKPNYVLQEKTIYIPLDEDYLNPFFNDPPTDFVMKYKGHFPIENTSTSISFFDAKKIHIEMLKNY